MVDRDIALQALSILCNGDVTSVQKQSSQNYRVRGASQKSLTITRFIPTVLDADETSQLSRSSVDYLNSVLSGEPTGGGQVSRSSTTYSATSFSGPKNQALDEAKDHLIDEDEFFDPQFDYDFTKRTDTDVYKRGGEVYQRPCGWYRFALKVLNKYDDNEWLGNRRRSTQSVSGEWPVSYHGTTTRGAEGIVEGFYKAGPRQLYGRGIYSTPYVSEAIVYAKTFTSKKDGKQYKAMLQNRINPAYRQIHNKGKYWLVPIPAGTPADEEQKMVEQAIRPYGLLLKAV